MTAALRTLALAVAAALAGGGVCSAADGQPISFVACPIARDTGPDTDVCFVAEHGGRRYALVNPNDYGMPQLRHRVLVEGRIRETPQVCGAPQIEGRVSVLAEVDADCDTVLPYDGSFQGVATGVFNSGTPEQRQRARDLARRAELDPSLSVEPAQPEPPAPTPPQPPFTTQTLTIHYPFDSDRASGPDMMTLLRLVDYAKASNGRIELTSLRGASRLSDGTVMTERPGMARRRADKLVGILTGVGVDPATVRATSTEQPPAPTGADDWRSRRIELTVRPSVQPGR